MAVHYTFNDPAAESAHRMRRMQEARRRLDPDLPPPAGDQGGPILVDAEGNKPGHAPPTHATRQEMIDARLQDGHMPGQAVSLTDSELRVHGARPMSLHRYYADPKVAAERRGRIAQGRKDDARMAGFQREYNASTGAPGYDFDAAGNAVEADAAAPKQTGFGQSRQHPVLAAREARGQETQARFDEQIAARQKGDELARQAGYKDQYHRQQASMEKTPGYGHRARDKWIATMMRQNKAVGMSDQDWQDMYDKHAKEGGTHAEIVKRIHASGGVMGSIKRAQGMAGAKGTQAERDAAVAANAKQAHEAMKMAGPQARAFMANNYINARDPFELARAGAANHALDPQGGHGNFGAIVGAEAANAQALAGIGGRKPSPLQAMDADRAMIREKPMGQRAQAYRDQHRALNAGQPENPEAQNMYLVTTGAGDAAQAAKALVMGTGGEEERAFLQEYTAAFVAQSGGSNRAIFENWSRKLGIPVTEESLQLWKNLTGTGVMNVNEYPGFNLIPGWGAGPVPSARAPQPTPDAK
jgi:hypothetical protein